MHRSINTENKYFSEYFSKSTCVYKINLLSDAIKYLPGGWQRVHHSPRSTSLSVETLFLQARYRFVPLFFFLFLWEIRAAASSEEGLLRVSRWFATLKCDAWLAIGRMQIENQYSSNHEWRRRFCRLNGKHRTFETEEEEPRVVSRARTPSTEKNI